MNDKKFRLPRKTKKRTPRFCLNPPDEKGNSLVVSPRKNQKNYIAYKQGILRSFANFSKKEHKTYSEWINKENYVSDEILKEYVNSVFRKNLRASCFNILKHAKEHPKARKAYFNFVNAHQKTLSGKDYGNTCCLTIESAINLLRTKYIVGKKKQVTLKFILNNVCPKT